MVAVADAQDAQGDGRERAGRLSLQEVWPGVYRVPIPIPAPLREVNAYALRGPHGWTLVDTGFHTPEAEARWNQAFHRLGIGPGDVEAVFVTHFHPDHFGAAGWLQQRTGAPVLMHDRELELARRIWRPAAVDGYNAFAARHGVPDELAAPLAQRRARIVSWVDPQPQVTPVREGEELRLGGRRWQVLWTPGHTDGLVVLWQPDEGLLLADDMVLPDISPNISAGPQATPNPLGRYLDSLGQVGRLPARRVLPGHRAPFDDLAGRCRELAEHHRRRLEEVEAIVAAGGPVTAWQVAGQLFGRVMDTLANVEFALGETVAHLDYLVEQGRLAVVEAGDEAAALGGKEDAEPGPRDGSRASVPRLMYEKGR
ncbi:MBL fold metallo-hydrolase [Thermaerobacter subterraneus]|uniref:Zn-dependent hydrolase, glyoxylase n=1 Tax=Thermaerobacter subterraneus DSM 13965 TaxID=867903 RepID=K6P1V1_9FIRM|nr:MBL fold metallo-hydrolase [Thermaerobacter subterraneus]EKP95020.1 Zn-dependent hydrolase, glyoxylase [Thermaerobacter subterraneus DSM 13965]